MLGGIGLLFRVDGRQTLTSTFSFEYMNPPPCGVKVNNLQRHQAPGSPQIPPTYKSPPQNDLQARSLPTMTIGMEKPAIRPHTRDTKPQIKSIFPEEAVAAPDPAPGRDPT